MGNCIQCNEETARTGKVYVGTSVSGSGADAKINFEPYTVPICDDCVARYTQGFSGILFYAALQLGWFTVARYGLFTPFGLLGAAIALFGLFRIGVKLAQRLLRGRDPATLPRILQNRDTPERDASDALRAALKKTARFGERQIRTLREQARAEGRD